MDCNKLTTVLLENYHPGASCLPGRIERGYFTGMFMQQRKSYIRCALLTMVAQSCIANVPANDGHERDQLLQPYHFSLHRIVLQHVRAAGNRCVWSCQDVCRARRIFVSGRFIWTPSAARRWRRLDGRLHDIRSHLRRYSTAFSLCCV